MSVGKVIRTMRKQLKKRIMDPRDKRRPAREKEDYKPDEESRQQDLRDIPDVILAGRHELPSRIWIRGLGLLKDQGPKSLDPP